MARPTAAATVEPENGLVAALEPLGLASLMPDTPGMPSASAATREPAPPRAAAVLAADAALPTTADDAPGSALRTARPEPLALPLVALQPSAAPTQALPTPAPVVVPTPSPQELLPVARVSANLRAGPGLTYAVAGSAAARQILDIVACNADRTWFKLENGSWIFANLVDNAPRALQVVQP